MSAGSDEEVFEEVAETAAEAGAAAGSEVGADIDADADADADDCGMVATRAGFSRLTDCDTDNMSPNFVG